MYIKPFLTVLTLIFFSYHLNSQEDCFNGIDDDGDGLTDINDSECQCSGLMSLNLFDDFEANICCPNFPTGLPGEGMDCLENWVVLGGSSDYLNTCGYIGGPSIPTAPIPFPSGDGCIGGLNQASNGEYIARCLDKPLIVGETYQFSFQVGFNDNGTSWTSISPIEVVLYGSTQCNFPMFSGCISAQAEWVVLGSVIASGPMNSWTFVSSSFVANEEIQAIALGTTCQIDKTYTFFDDFFLDGLVSCPPLEINDQIQQTGDCLSGIELFINGQVGFDVQWYYQGIAIQGATDLSHFVEPGLEGEYTVMLHNGENCGLYDPIDVQIDENVLIVSGIVDSIDCPGQNNASISLDIFGDNMPMIIEWDNGAADQDVFDLGPGSYTVTVTDANGCFGINTFEISEPIDTVSGAVMSLIQPSDTIVFGTATIVPSGGQAPYHISWSNGETSTTADSLPVGFNYAVITDSKGCMDTLEVAIFTPLTYTVQVVDDACSQCQGQISVQIQGGLPGYSIQWGNGADTTVLTDLCASFYNFMIVDSFGTQLLDTIDIRGTAPLSSDVLVLEDTICHGSLAGTISLDVSGGAGEYSYSWNTGDSTSSIANLGAGVYDVVVTDSNGCEDVRMFEIFELDELDISSNIIQPDCNTGSNGSIELIVSGGQTPYAALWSDGSMSLSLSDYPPGNYTVTITDNIGCEMTENFTLTNAGGLQADISVTQPTCFESPFGSIVIAGVNFDSLSVFINGQQIDEEVIQVDTGDYVVEIIDMMGCSLQESVSIIVPAALISNVVSVSDIDVNGLSSATISVNGGTPPYDIVWSNGESGLNPSMLTIGDNTATITDANGCVSQLIIQVEKPLLILDGIVIDNRCHDQCEGSIEIVTLESLGEVNYMWENGSTDQQLSGLCNGSYVVTVTDNFANEEILSFQITSPDSITFDEIITHESCTDENDGSIILDISGGSDPYSILNNGQPFLGENLSPGVYNLLIIDDNGCEMALQSELLEFSVPMINHLAVDPTCGALGEISILNFEDYVFDIVLSNDSIGSFALASGIVDELWPGTYQLTLDVNPACQIPLLNVELNAPEGVSDTLSRALRVENEQVVIDLDEFLFEMASSIQWEIDADYECLTLDNNGNCTVIQVDLIEDGIITAVITNESDCEQIVIFNVEVIDETFDEDFDVYAPNVITDRSGQRFKLVGSSDQIILERFTIFSRWGEKVYLEQDIALNAMEGWNLKLNGNPVASGVYVYMASYTLPNGIHKLISGDITVLR